jgi:flagellar basal body P-ring protein FlgI
MGKILIDKQSQVAVVLQTIKVEKMVVSVDMMAIDVQPSRF